MMVEEASLGPPSTGENVLCWDSLKAELSNTRKTKQNTSLLQTWEGHLHIWERRSGGCVPEGDEGGTSVYRVQ